MSEARSALKSMGLWALVILLCDLARIAEVFRVHLPCTLVDTFYLPVLSLLLVYYFGSRIAERGRLKTCLMGIAWLIFLLVFLREIKYSAFIGADADLISRLLWYLYYVPVLLIPLFSFYASCLINAGEKQQPTFVRLLPAAVTFFLIVLVLTNDLHRQVFAFPPNMADWNARYSYRWGFYAVTTWQFGLYIAALVIMTQKCRLTASRRAAWVPVIPFLAGGALMVLQLLGYEFRFHGRLLLGYPEIISFTIAFFWESCIRIGLIPTNESFTKLLGCLSLPVWIVSENGSAVYCSEPASALTLHPDLQPGDTMPDENTIRHCRKISGGFGIWQDDISEINGVKSKLRELQDRLQEESTLIRLENERKEDQARVDQQNAVYDGIAGMTQSQSAQIYALAQQAEKTDDPQMKQRCADMICFYGAYIKRAANLMLLAEGQKQPGAAELGLAVAESLRYLGRLGILCRFGRSVDAPCSAIKLIAAYNLFETLLEENLSALKAVYVTMNDAGGLCLRLTLEGFRSAPPQELTQYASLCGLTVSAEPEDDTLYVCLWLMKGGEAE